MCYNGELIDSTHLYIAVESAGVWALLKYATQLLVLVVIPTVKLNTTASRLFEMNTGSRAT